MHDEFAEALLRAEEDAAAYDALLAAEPDPLRRDLFLIGTAGLARRWGFPHDPFEVKFGPADLATMLLPAWVTEPPPMPEPEAGEVEIGVRATVRPSVDQPHWNPAQGLTLRWRGDGDKSARHRYLVALESWFVYFFGYIGTR